MGTAILAPAAAGRFAPGTRAYEMRTLLLLGFAFGFAYFDRNALSYLAPFLIADLHLSNTQIGALGSGLAVTWALSAYLVGRWSDSNGRRKPFLLTAMILFSLCSVLSGLAVNFGSLFAARMVMGAAEGPFLPICLAIMMSVSAVERRGVNAGTLQNVFGSLVGSVAAPVVLIALAQHFGWRSTFYLAGIPGLVSALLIWRFVAEPPRQAAMTEGADGPVEASLSPWAMLRHRNIALCAAISCCMVATLLIGSIFLPLYFTQVRGFSPDQMAWLMGALGLCPAVGGFLVSGLSDRIGRRPPMIAFCFLAVLCPVAALTWQGSALVLGILLFVGWIGIGAFPLFMGIIPTETLGVRHAATAMGLAVGIGEITGGVFGPLLGGWVADRAGLSMPIMVQAGAAVVAGLLALGLVETNPRFLRHPTFAPLP